MATAQDKWLVGAQLGTNLRWGEGQRLRLSGAFYDYFNVTGRLNPPLIGRISVKNRTSSAVAG